MQLAACPNVHMQLGGLAMAINGFDFHRQVLPPSSGELAHAWMDACIEAFGAPRCMFESNFPVDKAMFSYLPTSIAPCRSMSYPRMPCRPLRSSEQSRQRAPRRRPSRRRTARMAVRLGPTTSADTARRAALASHADHDDGPGDGQCRYGDETRIFCAHSLGTKPEALHDAGPKPLDQRIGLSCQRQQCRSAFVGLQVKPTDCLSRIQCRMKQGPAIRSRRR